MAACSNSSRAELRMKLARLGFTHHFAGRIFSFEDVERPKPAPDMYLAAAAACGVPAAQCLVIEDSDPGAVAGLAAGCRLVRVEGEVPDLVPWLAPRAA
jgi:HAD superfamily hydrolase (TIGR01509 family)